MLGVGQEPTSLFAAHLMTTLAVSIGVEYLMAYSVGVGVAAVVAVEVAVFGQAKVREVARLWVA